MARPLRVNVAGGWYHLTNRGQNRQKIFLCNEDRLHFLDLIGEMPVAFGVRVYAYALMTNHYHLLVSAYFGLIDQLFRPLLTTYRSEATRVLVI